DRQHGEGRLGTGPAEHEPDLRARPGPRPGLNAMPGPHTPVTPKVRPTLVKIGGSMMDDEASLAGLCAALAALRRKGERLMLVHGGGKDITRHLAWLQEEPVFRDGLRVTSPAALKVVEM